MSKAKRKCRHGTARVICSKWWCRRSRELTALAAAIAGAVSSAWWAVFG